ncbi:ABC transporter permease [Nocardioides sp. CFH 31398]|uniref:ABC transporter permease n=1 Tax=Nocardioides sp. CFH 31398 TaxID=2919579 RepID=UPI001F0642A8|nr:ABC transporter permease [Nocardioides sp. CFH 31398]MCH1867170.1 ABC transporter permease [Nocardioides sp. CFH 31398]
MSTVTPDAAPRGVRTLDVSSTPKVPFSRTVRVELRKMVDTRAGFWLLLVSGLLLLAITAIVMVVVLANDIGITANGWVQVMTVPLSLLLPIFAILSVTAEWSQRTGLVSFTLEPHRLKIIGAKLAAVVLLVIGTMVLAAALGAVANVVYGGLSGNEVTWNVDGSEFFWTVVSQLLYFLMAFGLAMLILSTPASIAVFYVVSLLLPFMVYGPVYALVSWGPDVLPWIDLNYAMAPLLGGGGAGPGVPALEVTGTTYAQLAVATLIWVVLPMVLGGRRVARAEIK